MLPDIVDKQVFDQFTMICERNLEVGVSQLSAGTGVVQADAFIELGTDNKSISLTPQLLIQARKMGHAALLCRNGTPIYFTWHAAFFVFELMIEKSFVTCCGPSSGPNNVIFKRF